FLPVVTWRALVTERSAKIKRAILPLVRSLVCPPLGALFLVWCYRFYSRALRNVSAEIQLFLLVRDEIGSIIYVIQYAHYWQIARGRAAIVVLIPHMSTVKSFASL